MKIDVERVATLTGHRDCIYGLEGSMDDPVIFSAGGDGMVVAWDLRQPELGKLLVQIPSSVYALRYLPASNELVIGQNFEGIHLIDLKTKKEVHSLRLPDADAIFDIQHIDDLLWVATGSGRIYVVDYSSFKLVDQLLYSSKSARCLAINLIKKEIAIGYSDHSIRIVDLATHELKLEWPAHTNSVFTLAYSPDYRFLLSAGRDAHLKIWDTNTSYLLHKSIVAHMYAINHITYSPSGQFFLTCSMDKSIKLWDASEFKLLKVIDRARYAGHATSINNVYWSTYQDQIISCSDDRHVSIWNLKFSLI